MKKLRALFHTGIIGLIATGISSPSLSADSTDHSAIAQTLDTFLSEATAKDTFSGTVLLAKDGEVIYTTARGLASKRFDVPMKLDTKLNLGSMNKMFTSVAIMQLVEQGKISLTDTLDKFLDETWLPRAVSQKIEVQHLLTHASGLGSYFNEEFFGASKTRFINLEDYKPLIVNDTLAFEPGTGFRYSNTGMFLLGVIIENVTGTTYFDHIKQSIYAPAGMENSGCYEMDQPVKNLAIGYTPNPDNRTGWNNNIYMHVLKGGPAGGCFSTVEDLHRFAATLVANTYLNAENTQLLFVPKSEFHDNAYGYGFISAGTADNRITGHSGGFLGINSNLDIFLDSGYVAVVMSNYGGAAQPIVAKIRELLE